MQKLLTTFVLFAMTAICSTASSAENAQDLEIERAARAFRIATYDGFRLNRDLYDARREAGDGLLAKWHEAGAPDEFRLNVLNWFGYAAELPAGSPLPPMPALPEVPPAPAAEPKPVGARQDAPRPGRGRTDVRRSWLGPTAVRVRRRPGNADESLAGSGRDR